MKLNIKPTAPQLLDWYDRHRRHLPWRFAPGEKATPMVTTTAYSAYQYNK